jgi:hypothetical protein
MSNSIRFHLVPNDSEVEKMTRKSIDFLKHNGLSDHAVETQVMILSELIGNGKLFDLPNIPDLKMTVLLSVWNDAIIVEIKRPIRNPADGKLRELDKTIQWIRGYQDPFEPYAILLEQASTKTKTNEVDAFALARIAYEGGAVLDFFLSEDNILNFSAVRNLNGNN